MPRCDVYTSRSTAPSTRVDSRRSVAGRSDGDRVVGRVGQVEFDEEPATVGVRGWRPCGAGRRARAATVSATRVSAGVEELLGPVAAHPRLEDREVVRIRSHAAHRHLVCPEGALDLHTVDLARSGPTLRRPQHHRGPRGRAVDRGRAPGAGVGLDLVDARRALGERGGQSRGARARGRRLRRTTARSRARRAATRISSSVERPSTVGPEILYSLRWRIGSTAPSRAAFRKRMPFHEPSSGPVSASPSPIDARHQQVGVVEGGAERVHERVAELAALVDRTGRRHADVARHAAGCGELAEELAHATRVLR